MTRLSDSSEIQRGEALLSWIQQFAPYGVITLDKSLCIQSWNSWMESHSGLRFDEVVGRDIVKLFPDLEKRKLISPFARALSGESSVLSTALHRYLLPMPSPSRDPAVPHMLQTAQIAPLLSGREVGGVVVVIEDVTQRETQAEALSRQHRRDEVLSWALAHFLKSDEPRKSIRQLFFKIAEHLDFDTFLLYIRDPETGALNLYTTGGVQAQLESEFAQDPLLIAVADLREKIIFDSVQLRFEPEFATLKKARIAAGVAIPLLINERSLGALCFATWSRPSVAEDEADLLGAISQYLSIAVDRENTNAQLKKARAQLADHAELLERQVEERTLRLQETISALETFSYTLAHDLKAPVRGMIGFCEILQQDFAAALPPEANLIVEKLARTPRRMEALIKDLLNFSNVSRQEVVLSPVEIEPIIEDLVSLRLPGVAQAITIRTPLGVVRGHPALLHQALSNLIDNAIKFVEPDARPKITIFTEQVSQSSPSTRSRPLLFNSTEAEQIARPRPDPKSPVRAIRIWVQDEGIGVPLEAHQKIFGIFERNVTDEIYEGTGMGLAIVARAMQRMGGACGVESQPGKGSRFWLELPAA